MVPPCSDKVSRAPSYSSLLTTVCFRLRDFHPLSSAFPNCSTNYTMIYHNWASPRSLATTRGISVDFCSSGYLDVSVPQVPFTWSIYSTRDTVGSQQLVSLFGNPRINACTRLPEAYRSVPRPSSALDAKAFTISS